MLFKTCASKLVILSLIVAPAVSSASIIGFLGNFDVINDTGITAHGFEIDLVGVHSAEITDVFGGPGRGFPTGRGFGAGSVERYGSPTITEYTNGSTFGTKVVYQALPLAGGTWDYGTPSGTFVTPGDNCWSGGGVGYNENTPCDHFGVGTSVTPTDTIYSWLIETAEPGVLTNSVVSLPAPVATIIQAPPPQPGDPPAPPAVNMVIEAPAPEVGYEFGDALWVKVFTTELPDPVRLEDLIAGVAPVDQALAEPPEMEWQLLQWDSSNPIGPGNGQLESDNPAAGGDAVLRRYEFYSYIGAFDLETNEALPTFGDSQANSCVFDADHCDPNLLIDVGHYLGAQNMGVNLNGPAPVIPEPGSLALVSLALAGLGFSRHNKQ